MGLKAINPLIKAVAKKAYVTPKMEVRTLESLGLEMKQQIGDILRLNLDKKIQCLKDCLTGVLKSEHCEMPDFMAQIPKGTTKEETVQLLKQMFEDSKFFSRVSTCEERYGKNFEFAKIMGKLLQTSTESISNGKSFKEVLRQIAKGYSKEATINTKHIDRKNCSGIYRGDIKPKYFLMFRIDNGTGWVTGYGGFKPRYREYIKRLDNGFNIRKSPYDEFTITKCRGGLMSHPNSEDVAKNMEIISERYKVFQNLVSEYKSTGKLNAKQRKQADEIISEIYYLMANTCPFKRGSNGISDVLMRSQYSALGINKPHIKQGVGPDLEAFCMNLDEYKIKWNSFFEL